MRTARTDALAARVDAVLARRGLGPDTLSVIENVLRHGTTPPPAAPPLVREWLGKPLAAANAITMFDHFVPAALQRLASDVPAPSPGHEIKHHASASLAELLDAYLAELAEAQRIVRGAIDGGRIDAPAILSELEHHPPSAASLRGLARVVDAERLNRATIMFLDATARFAHALRESGTRPQFPEKAMRFDSAVGVVSIGTRGDDLHGPDAAVIIDPGGNDVYERAPVTGGAISAIIDLGGDDLYRGSDPVAHGLSAIIDFSGNDRYAMSGSGLGAAVAGAAVIVDFSGDDIYEAKVFGQGAAAFGLGAIIDLRGNDAYRLHAGGQGFGLAGGVGLLWDRAGNDVYAASGLPDAFKRGGGQSWAQGAARGFRTMLGGGIGILRDDAGNDSYEAEMFAQGTSFYYGIGLLWDGGGDDRYRAVRYAQGNGVHEAIGVLRDESGDDQYELTFGVGQGMGLDLAVGVLFDGAGDDVYRSQVLAQGAATANGVGIVIDGGGADLWHMGADQRSWGRAEWSRRLPSLGVLVYVPARATFVREGKTMPQPADSSDFRGPLGNAPISHEPSVKRKCAPVEPATVEGALSLADALRSIAPAFAGGSADPATYAFVQRQLTTRLQAAIAELPGDDFNVAWSLSEALPCALIHATAEEANSMWTALEGTLVAEPATPFAGPIAGALRVRPAPAPQMQRILKVLDEHPRCGVRTAALRLRHTEAADDAARESTARAAQMALRSSCWQLQAAALDVLKRLGIAPSRDAVLPSFLRGASEPTRWFRRPGNTPNSASLSSQLNWSQQA